jgi:glutamine synthetase
MGVVADTLWIARWALLRIAEITFKPKLMPGEWSGTALRANVSSIETRQSGGIQAIEKMIKKLGTRHKEHMLCLRGQR